tara:strand:- start:631 stop:999 length:369 start_codon:yes stop_codon:yes gene_type:complete
LSELYIGTDLVDIDRIQSSIEKYQTKFLNKVFSIKEQQYCQSKSRPSIHYAGKFAAKEAVIKSIKSSGYIDPIELNTITILNNPDGSPYVVLDLLFKGNVKVSISHTETHAIAFALAELNQK